MDRWLVLKTKNRRIQKYADAGDSKNDELLSDHFEIIFIFAQSSSWKKFEGDKPSLSQDKLDHNSEGEDAVAQATPKIN